MTNWVGVWQAAATTAAVALALLVSIGEARAQRKQRQNTEVRRTAEAAARLLSHHYAQPFDSGPMSRPRGTVSEYCVDLAMLAAEHPPIVPIARELGLVAVDPPPHTPTNNDEFETYSLLQRYCESLLWNDPPESEREPLLDDLAAAMARLDAPSFRQKSVE